MAGIGSGRISAPGLTDSGGLVDVIVDPDGSGDYTTISDAVTAEAVGTVIGVRSGTINEIADIVMKTGQVVIGLGWDDSTIVVNMGNFQWFMEQGCRVEGLRLNTVNTTNGEALFYATSATANDWCVRNCKIDMSGNTSYGYAFEWGTVNRNDYITIENIHIIGNGAISNGVMVAGGSAVGTQLSYYNEITQITCEDMGMAPTGFVGANWLFQFQIGHSVVSDIHAKAFPTTDTTKGFLAVQGIVGGQEYWGNVFTNLSFIVGNTVGISAQGISVNCVKSTFSNVVMYKVNRALVVQNLGAFGSQLNFSNFSIHSIDTYAGQTGIVELSNTSHIVMDNFMIEGNQDVRYLAVGTGAATGCSFSTFNNFNMWHASNAPATQPLVYVNGYSNVFTGFSGENQSSTKRDIYVDSGAVSYDNLFVGFEFNHPNGAAGVYTDADRIRFRDVNSAPLVEGVGATYTIYNGYYEDAAAPTVNDDVTNGFEIGDKWRDTAGGIDYTCRDATTGAAVWIAAGVSSADEIWDVLVDPNPAVGDYTTVGAALATEATGATIGVSPGVYDESGADWTFKAGQVVFALNGVYEGGVNPNVECDMGDSVITMADRSQLKGVLCNFVATTDEYKVTTADDSVIEECTFDYRGTGGAQGVSGIAVSGVRARIEHVRSQGSALMDDHFRMSADHNKIINMEITGGVMPYASCSSGGQYNLMDQVYVHSLDNWAGVGVDDNGNNNTYTNWKVIDTALGGAGVGLDVPNNGETTVRGFYARGLLTGIDIFGPENNISDVVADECTNGFIISANRSVFTNLIARDCTTIGFDISSNNSSFTNLISDGTPTTDFDLDDVLRSRFINCGDINANANLGGTSEDVRFIGCSFVSLTLQAGAARTVIDDCLITTITDGGTFTKQGIDVHVSTVDPTVNDDVNDGFVAGKSFWYNSTDDTMWKCDDNTATAAVWTNVGGASYDQQEKTQADSPVTVAALVEYNNTGAVGACTFNLPDASTVYQKSPQTKVRFIVVVAQNMIVQAAAGDSIHSNGVSSSAGGTATSNTPYSVLELVPVGNNDWIAVAQTGTWVYA